MSKCGNDGEKYAVEMGGEMHVNKMNGLLRPWIKKDRIACACRKDAAYGIVTGLIHDALQAKSCSRSFVVMIAAMIQAGFIFLS